MLAIASIPKAQNYMLSENPCTCIVESMCWENCYSIHNNTSYNITSHYRCLMTQFSSWCIIIIIIVIIRVRCRTIGQNSTEKQTLITSFLISTSSSRSWLFWALSNHSRTCHLLLHPPLSYKPYMYLQFCTIVKSIIVIYSYKV